MPKKTNNPLQLPPGLKVRGGKLHYRFRVSGQEYANTTGLAATERNVSSALRKLEQAKLAVDAGDSPRPIQPRRFSSAAEAYLDWHAGEFGESTHHRIVTSFASLGEFFKATMVHHVTPGNIEDYKAWRRSTGIKEVTLRHDLHALSGFFKYARRQRWCKADPLRIPEQKVSIPSDKDATRNHVVTPEEEAAYFTLVAKHKTLHDVARVVLETGMRPDVEVCQLLAGDVDLKARTVTVRRSKTTAGRRTLRINAVVAEILGRRAAGKPATARLFVGERGRITKLMDGLDKTHAGVLRKFNKASKTVKMHWVVYELRHTYATRLAAAGCPLPTLAAILGHADLRSVLKYIHVQKEGIAAWSGLSAFCPRPQSILVDSGASGALLAQVGGEHQVSGKSINSASLQTNWGGGADRS